MKNLLKNLVMSAFVVAPFALTGCTPECVDFADCADKANEENREYTCVEGTCKAGSPFPDAGSGGGSGGGTGGGTGGGDTGGGAGGGTGGGGGGDDAGMDDAGMDDAGMDDAGMDDAGMDDAGMDDAGMDDAGMDDAGMDDAGMDDAGVDDAGVDAGTDDAGVPELEIAQARSNADAGLSTPVDISGATVTYLRPSFGTETAGFFVQASAAGPAIFVFVDPATLTPAPQVGDSVAFTATAYSMLGGLAQITAVSNWQRLSTGGSVTSFTQDLTASATIAADLGNLESELISIRGVLDGGFGSASAPFVSAFMATTAAPTANVKFRAPQTLVDSVDLERGCDITVGPTPMWRFTAQAQPSAWVTGDITVNACPAPTVVGAVAPSATSVNITFSRLVAASSVLANGSQFTFDNGLTASAATVNGKSVTVTTTAQTGTTTYLATVASTVTDTRATPLGTPNTTTFLGYNPPRLGLMINEVDYDQTVSDDREFVEILNTSAADIDLTNVALVLVNGNNNNEYLRLSLAAASPLAPGEYLVVANNAVVVPATAKVIRFTTATNSIQNGSPDGLALIDTVGLTVIDALSYAGSMTAANLTGFTGTRSLVEGSVLTTTDSNSTEGSLSRIPNGFDNDNAASNWSFTTTVTPGVVNQ